MTGTQAAYVEQIGKNIAVQSGLANSQSAFTVTLLNSSVDNAFAIPGGYVYVTRQLVSLMNNEAELAGVLGHEVGHVAARHSAARERAAQRNSILGVLGSIVTGVLLGNSALGSLGQQVFSAAPQLLTAKYSRKQETEADNLGIRYLAGAGYDPHAMATVLQSLAAQNALDAQLQGRDASIPQWASTHPDPASRVRTALSAAGNADRHDQPRHLPHPHRRAALRRRSAPGRDRGQHLHPPRPAADLHRPERLLHGQRHRARCRSTGRAGRRSSRARPTAAISIPTCARCSRRSAAAAAARAADRRADTINGLPVVVRRGAGQHRPEHGRRGGRRLRVLARPGVPFRDDHARRAIIGVRADVRFDAAHQRERGGAGDSAAGRRGHGGSGATPCRSLASRMAYGSAQVERFRVLNGLASNAQVVPGREVQDRRPRELSGKRSTHKEKGGRFPCRPSCVSSELRR